MGTFHTNVVGGRGDLWSTVARTGQLARCAGIRPWRLDGGFLSQRATVLGREQRLAAQLRDFATTPVGQKIFQGAGRIFHIALHSRICFEQMVKC